ncbi:MAG: Plug domain-containing protein [Gemmatimonadaceae bacterium]
MKFSLLLTLASAALLAASRLASAQTDSAKRTRSASVVNVRVYLVRADDTPVVGAEVSVKGVKVERLGRTDSSGMAVLQGFPGGNVVIHVRAIGSRQSVFLTRVTDGDNAFTITVDAATTTLAEVRVVESRSVAARFEDFEMRTKRGDASAVITQAQIERRNPVALSQMLRGLPGLRLADSLGNTVAVSTRGQKLSRNFTMVPCVMRMMIDGIVMPAYTSIDAVTPIETYGIEIFNGPSRIPLDLGGVRTDSWCGLIAIWTRSGSRAD